jgi:lyso-ornithine lipid O-acyltransferase
VIRGVRAVYTVCTALSFLVGWAFRFRLRRPPRDSPEHESWRRAFFTGAARGLLRRLRVEVQIEGPFPPGPGLLVTNHLSYLDVLVLAVTGPTVFVSRADVREWPLIGPLTRWCSTIYIDRGRRELIPEVIGQMRSTIQDGARIVFFPEGTSGSGAVVMRFRPSLFGVATEGGYPVHVAALSYHTCPGDPAARDAVCWWGDTGFVGHFFRLAGLRSVRATVRFVPGELRDTDRKRLASRCQVAVESAFVPVTGSGNEA